MTPDKLKLEGFYIWVDNLDEAIAFYEQVFQRKIVNREKDRWADFGTVDGANLFGIYNYTVDGDECKVGNNVTPEVRTTDAAKEWGRIAALNPKSISEIIVLEQPALYKYFQFEDAWGNTWEVTEHYYD